MLKHSFFILFMFSLPAWAEICDVPKHLNGLTLLFTVDEEYGHFSPDPIGVLQTSFSKENFSTQVVQNNHHFIGKYTYLTLDDDLAKLTIRQILGPRVIRYSMTLVCTSQKAGYYIYSQIEGPRLPHIRQNTGNYMIRNIK
ncbi:hypothetical protein [uncultured Shewanella sp.]|uniref:hypothetical protein n=1 Tax=uncultured Shewanella sp. TaxID=173975 RepID=UPI002620378B|nr:hypothetical protein [uncultured Shewanella sp.]